MTPQLGHQTIPHHGQGGQGQQQQQQQQQGLRGVSASPSLSNLQVLPQSPFVHPQNVNPNANSRVGLGINAGAGAGAGAQQRARTPQTLGGAMSPPVSAGGLQRPPSATGPMPVSGHPMTLGSGIGRPPSVVEGSSQQQQQHPGHGQGQGQGQDPRMVTIRTPFAGLPAQTQVQSMQRRISGSSPMFDGPGAQQQQQPNRPHSRSDYSTSPVMDPAGAGNDVVPGSVQPGGMVLPGGMQMVDPVYGVQPQLVGRYPPM